MVCILQCVPQTEPECGTTVLPSVYCYSISSLSDEFGKKNPRVMHT